jgi:hypothetical protein
MHLSIVLQLPMDLKRQKRQPVTVEHSWAGPNKNLIIATAKTRLTKALFKKPEAKDCIGPLSKEKIS